MPDWLREQFPTEITIVIQHEFWDLAVTADRFSVGLSFSDRDAMLTVPFDAVTTFVDPYAEFGLKFDAHDSEEGDDESPDPSGGDESDAQPPRTDGGGDVVRLDSFRKS